MNLLRRFHSVAEQLSEAGARVSSLALLLMTIGITVDVIARAVLGFGTKATVELTGYLMVAVVFFGLAPAQRINAHIRIDLVLALLPKPVSRVVDFINSLLFLVYCIVLAYLGMKSALTSYDFGSSSRTNIDIVIWPFQLLIPIGLFSIILVLISEMILGKQYSAQSQPANLIHD